MLPLAVSNGEVIIIVVLVAVPIAAIAFAGAGGVYREIVCALINHGEHKFTLEAGQRIAQLLIEAIITPEPVWAESLDETARGVGGFGSTGRG